MALPPFPEHPNQNPLVGGMQFSDAAPMICGVVDNGVCVDDPRVMVRLNEATKIIMDTMIPVGGMAVAGITAIPVTGDDLQGGPGGLLILPKYLENVIEAHTLVRDGTVKVYGEGDVTQAFYELMNNSVYLDPTQSYDNPLIDWGLNGNPADPSDVRRIYLYPGLQPQNAVVVVTGKKRFLPVTHDEDYLIVQNIEALKCIILAIERYENAAPDEALKYRQAGLEILQSEVKNHILDPRNYMFRRSEYREDLVSFSPDTLGWIRAQIALDIPEAIRIGKRDLSWAINQAEKRIMQRSTWKDCIIDIQADVVGGMVYFPLNVESVLAVDLNGHPIPVRSRFFEHLENGPGMFSCDEFLKDMGDEFFPATGTIRRKYKLIADCHNLVCLNAVCKLRWLPKKSSDRMVIKNYEALRLMVSAKFLEEREDWKNALANQQSAIAIMESELRDYLRGIRHTVHVQTLGFGLSDVGRCQ